MKPTRTRRTTPKRSTTKRAGRHVAEIHDPRDVIAPHAPDLMGFLVETALVAPIAKHRDEAHEILASRGLWPADIAYPFTPPAGATALELETRFHHRDSRTNRRRTYKATRRIEFKTAA